MQSKARMTFRFEQPQPKSPGMNANAQQNTEKDAKLAVQSNRPEQPDRTTATLGRSSQDKVDPNGEREFMAWNSPYQDDIHALEDIIRKADIGKGAAYEPYLTIVPPNVPAAVTPGKPSASIPKLPIVDLEDDKPSDGMWSGIKPEDYALLDRGRDRNPSWGRVFVSVAAAVATGALFGYMVLSLFSGEPMFPGKSSDASATPTVSGSPSPTANPAAKSHSSSSDASASDLPATSGKSQAVGAQTESSSIKLTANVYYMLQFGVFQNEDSMGTAEKQLEERGLAYAGDSSDGYRVYAGAAGTRDEAEALAARLPDTQVYIKAFGGEATTVDSDRLSASGASFLNAGAELARKLVQYSRTSLLESSPEKLKTADMADLKKAEQQWLNTTAAADRLQAEALDEGKEVVSALTSAIEHMEDYQSKPSFAHLWSVQSETMKAILADHRLRSLLQTSGKGSGS